MSDDFRHQLHTHYDGDFRGPVFSYNSDESYARTALWFCEDGWVVEYTTSRITTGPNQGKFLARTFKRRSKDWLGNRWFEETWFQVFSTRKAAKARALQLYRAHSPKWAAEHPDTQEHGPVSETVETA